MPPGRDISSVMLVSLNSKAVTNIEPLLPPGLRKPVVVQSAGEARRLSSMEPADIVIINTPLADDFGLQLAIDLSDGTSGVLLLVKSEQYEQTSYKAAPYGIFTLVKPFERMSFTQTVRLLMAMNKKLKTFERKAENLQAKMEEIRIVNRAKLLLMDRLKMSEPEAHRFIEKSAMDHCVKRKEIAENIIRTYDN